MKKFLFLLLVVGTIYGDWHWNNTLIPDLRVSARPVVWNDTQGIACLIEGGRQIFRANGTYGRVLKENYLAKISLEYLSQRLGLVYLSGREHKWVKQGAIGGACRFPYGEVAVSYSTAPKRKLFTHVIPRRNALCDKRIAGSSSFSLGWSSFFSPWECAEITAGLLYDLVHFKRHFQKNKTIQGPGAKLSLDQGLWGFGYLHLGVSLQAPYVFYEGALSSQINFCERPLEIALYGQRVRGWRGLPSSSRIGIEIGIAFDRFLSSDFDGCTSVFQRWLSVPAVYQPQVLVVKDEREREFCLAPLATASIEHLSIEEGFLTLDTAPYFKGTGPLIYSSSPLPGNLKLNPATGKITGVIDENLKEPYAIIIKATNYSGEAEKTMFFNFNK